MDDLPTIKPLSATQRMIREALKSAKPLNISKPSVAKDFIVFDHQMSAKPKTNSLFDRFLRHKTITSKNAAKDESPTKRRTCSQHKWSLLKDNMTQELETKRLESLKLQELNDKLENEELIDSEEELEKESEEVIEDSKEDNEENDNKSDKSEDRESAEEEEEEEEDNECSEEEEVEDDGSDREVNPFINDEADEEDEELVSEEEVENNRQPNNCTESKDKNCGQFEKNLNLSFIEIESKDNDCHQNSQSVEVEECKESDLNDNVLNSSINSLDESFSQRRFATQKIALSPFITQKLKPRLDSNQEFSDLITKLDTNAEEFDSQTLLGLCSGNFLQIKTEDTVETNEEIDGKSQSIDTEDPEEDKEVINESKRLRKVFNIESDGESDSEEDNDRKDLEEKEKLKTFNGSDGEELVVTEAEVSEGEEEEADNEEEEEEIDEEVAEQDIGKIRKSFFDNEAELSGSDMSSDEDEGEDDDAYDVEDVDPEDMPSESELRDQIGRMHNKNLLDEDKRQLMIMKELMFEDGDLHDDGGVREKKFRWNFETDHNFVNDYINEDSDDNYMDSDEDQNTKTPALKMSFQSSDTALTIDDISDKVKARYLKRTTRLESKNGNSLTSFLVKDQRLNAILNPKRSLNPKNGQSMRPNKKFKNCKKNSSKPSIFDLMNQN